MCESARVCFTYPQGAELDSLSAAAADDQWSWFRARTVYASPTTRGRLTLERLTLHVRRDDEAGRSHSLVWLVPVLAGMAAFAALVLLDCLSSSLARRRSDPIHDLQRSHAHAAPLLFPRSMTSLSLSAAVPVRVAPYLTFFTVVLIAW